MSQIKKRQVFFLSGFDPRGARYIHRLYRDESQKQSRLNGLEFEVGDRKKREFSDVWDIRVTDRDDATCDTQFEMLRWDDVVRSYWPKQWGVLFSGALLTYWTLLRADMHRSLLRVSWPPALAVFFPLLVILTGLGLILSLLPILIFISPLWLKGLAAAVPAIGLLLLILYVRKTFFWLLRTYAFVRQWANQEIPELNDRMPRFAQRINQALNDPKNDEILIVSHSIGTILAMPLLADVLSKHDGKGKLSILTLGNCIPLVSFLPDAESFRDNLTTVALANQIEWVDYSMRGDGASFPHDPIATSGIERPPDARVQPEIRSPRFFKLFPPGRYSEIKKDKLRLHLQYFMAGELEGEYDFFKLTAGFSRLTTDQNQ